MKLIVGLGNIGKEYELMRHNVGFLLLDHIAEEFDTHWHQKTAFKANIAEFAIGAEKIILVKPTTFYNLSGEAVQAVSAFYKLESTDILVIHDELALPFGTLRTRIGGSDAGNNGIKNISALIGDQYGRIRVGIANPLITERSAADFVLSTFFESEIKELNGPIASHVLRFVEHFIHEDQQFEHTSVKLAT